MMRNLIPELVSAPISALEVQGSHILSGETSYLHIYNLNTGNHLHQLRVLGPHIIHGICKGKDGVCAVFGQKAVCIIHLDLEENIRIKTLCDTPEFPDWILDVSFLSHETSETSSNCLGIVLAHNSVMLWDWELKVCIEHVHCAENCILYSAKILGDTWQGMTVCAGTVFNQVVLWTPREEKDSMGRVQVSRRLIGHQGVIFNMSYHHKRNLLCSVSDDRSIRLWHLDLESIPRVQSDDAQKVLYGHSARVWDAKILDDTIVSVGEDAVCCVWNNDGDIIHRFSGHKGRSIWSLAVHEDQKTIVTGGGDSSIRMWSIASNQEQCIKTEELDSVREAQLLLSNSSTDNEFNDADKLVPRQLAVLDSGKIIIMTLNGCLLSYTLHSKEWRLLSQDVNYQSYSILTVSPSHQIAAIANIHGNVKVIALDSGRTLVEEAIFSGKMLNLCWMDEENLFASGPDGLVFWLKLSRSSDRFSLGKHTSFKLPEAQQRWLTTITLIPHQEGAVVCGDRRGSVLLYSQLQRGKGEEDLEPAGPAHCLLGVHGKAGVTHVCHHAGYVYSSGRDGTYRQYGIQGTRLQMLNTFKVFKGFNWIESIAFTSSDDIMVSGFHSSSFLIWSTQSSEKLVEIQCGGGHRAWGFATCIPTPGGTSPTVGDRSAGVDATGGAKAVFAFIKAKKVIVCTAPAQKLQQHPILKESLHGRKVSCIKYLANVAVPEGECALVASGSEDNAVNISLVIFPPSNPSTIHVLHRLNVHISSVRCLATCPSSYEVMDQGEVTGGHDPGQRLLLFSVGGRRTIQCWRVRIPTECFVKDQIHKWMKSACTVEHLASYGNTDNVKQRRWLKKHGRPTDAETRFMSVCVWKESEVGLPKTDGRKIDCLLGVGGSDAVIRVFTFSEDSKVLSPLLSTDCHQGCLLTTVGIVHRCPWGTVPILLTAGTNGKIALWDIQKAIKECGKDVRRERLSNEDGGFSNNETKMDSDVCLLSEASISNRGDTMETKISPSQEGVPNSQNFETNEKSQSVPSTLDGSSDLQEECDALWDRDEDIGRLLLSVSAHQSGVNALCITKIDDDHYIMVSGGDDNAIHLALISVSSSQSDQLITLRLESSYTVSQSHAAQVTGLCFIDRFTAVSSSIDQRMIVWRVDLTANDTPTFEVMQICSSFIMIADCCDMTLFTLRDADQCIAVCGQGVQVLRLKEH
ncbi:tRNA (34-2'-O)-methyltransferase regulator WDR6-like [Asterias amurensis]|uniref:tRNA (34-2'-O)-methyltransferase regulator WDR6-like n=1 Tax=Asterias amurensis TaxID=7602 RepID=UPI003AB582AE